MSQLELTNLSVSRLLTLYSDVLAELRSRGVVRSTNNPVADYAEYLVVKALNLTPADKCMKGYDALDNQGRKYEIKARRTVPGNGSRMLSAIRDCPARHFDFLAGVLFKADFTFDKACLVPFDIVEAEAKYREHVNAHIFHLRDSVWKLDRVRDITNEVQSVIASDSALSSGAVAKDRADKFVWQAGEVTITLPEK